MHATLSSLPMHPFMNVEVTSIIEHSTTQAWNAANGAMPPF
jgi:muconolactone delta-isomerase